MFLSVVEGLGTLVAIGPEFPPPVGYLPILLEVGPNPVTGDIWVRGGRLWRSILHRVLFVFLDRSWWSFEGTGVLRASICSVGSLGSGVFRCSWRDAMASVALAAPVLSPGGQLPPLVWGRFWVHHSCLGTSKEPCTSGTLLQHQRGSSWYP